MGERNRQVNRMAEKRDLPAFMPGPPGERPRLLIVDDQPINIHAMYQVFARDHQVFMATSGAQALAICREKQPDLVLLDVVMPDMDGYAVCAELQRDETTRHIPVIFVTAHDNPDDETRGLEVGAVDFISKPINPAVVRARVRTHLTLKFQSDLLRQMAFIDGLTGVFNRRYFDERLDAEWRRAERNSSSLGLILIDVDYFKRFNDRYGHQAGDDCLKRVAGCMKRHLRRGGDFVARYGGEEFACILPETGFDGTLALAQSLEQQVRALAIPNEGSDVCPVVTISLGVAGKSADAIGGTAELLALADAQLYQAKRAGRGRVCGALIDPMA
jgi:diguanylate cyclase (GGDEF)-like protein